MTGSIDSLVVNIAEGATLDDVNGGISSSSAVTNNGILTLGSNDTVSSLVNSGTINGSSYTLTAATYALEDGSEVYANLGAGTLTTTGLVSLFGNSAAANVNVSAGSVLSLMGPQLLLNTSTVGVDGSLVLNGGDQTVNILNGNGNVYVNTYNFVVNGGGDFTGNIHGADTQLTAQGGTLT